MLQELTVLVGGDPPPLEAEEAKPVGKPVVKTEVKPAAGETEAKAVGIDIRKVLKRELKIHGQVNGDGLSFVSLVRQIEAAVKAGYTESEVTESVLRAVSPSLKLRSYLEMVTDLSVARLRQILRAHYKQTSGTELYQELSGLCQASKESAQDVLIRAMNLKHQIIFASHSTDSTVKYDPALVQSLFIHVVETGLQQESIRAKLRPLLETQGVSDELMERMIVAVSAERV